MSRRANLVFNATLGTALAVAYHLVVHGAAFDEVFVLEALRESGWAGLAVGVAIGLGATVGARPQLGWKRCIPIQLGVVLSSALGALLWWTFPGEMAAVDETLRAEATKQGIQVGSGVGAVVGTVIQVVQVYFRRRRPPTRSR